MKGHARPLGLTLALLAVSAAALVHQASLQAAQAPAIPPGGFYISQAQLLTGLAPGSVFPFVDTTPRLIQRAHIAVTDATTNCSPGAAAPSNVQVLVGEAGVNLVPVMTAATNTGISTAPGQCVFHVTVTAGAGGVPARVTDIAVRNGGPSPLAGIHTITVSADVR
jgi:hypothetical protein